MARSSPDTSNMTATRAANAKRSLLLELARDWISTGDGQDEVLTAVREWVAAEARCGEGRT